MSNKNPVRQVIQNLIYEFKIINTECLHFNVEINALIDERTNAENHKLKRRFCRCLNLVDSLKPETANYFKDKSKEIVSMLQLVSTHYDDLKRRYFWALDRLADMTIKVNQMTENQLKKEARNKRLGKSWQDFCKDKEEVDEKYIYSRKCTEIGDIDKLLNGIVLGNDETTQKEKKLLPTKKRLPQNEKEQKKRKNYSRMFTKVTRSPVLTKIEDISVVDESEYEDQLRNSTENSGFSSKTKKSKKYNKSSRTEIIQERANASEIKMQIYALMAEVAERDELIDSLTSEIKVKDAQIIQLLEVIRREKLGTKPSILSKFHESDTFEQETE